MDLAHVRETGAVIQKLFAGIVVVIASRLLEVKAGRPGLFVLLVVRLLSFAKDKGHEAERGEMMPEGHCNCRWSADLAGLVFGFGVTVRERCPDDSALCTTYVVCIKNWLNH